MIETSRWEPVKELMTTKTIELSVYDTRNLAQLNSYKAASKLIGKNKRVLDIGCGSGLGTWILAKECGYAVGIEDNITACQKNWVGDNIHFQKEPSDDMFDAIINFHYRDFDLANLNQYGLLIVKTHYLSCFYKDGLFTHIFKFPVCGGELEDIYFGIKN